jgi:hypothetical protein
VTEANILVVGAAVTVLVTTFGFLTGALKWDEDSTLMIWIGFTKACILGRVSFTEIEDDDDETI